MKAVTTFFLILIFAFGIFASEDANEPAQSTSEPITDVNIIVNRANIVAYYQGKDGKAKVNMTITDSKGLKRNREFIILRADVNDGGDQKYFVYFIKPVDVRKMVYLVHKHADPNKDDDRWLYLPALDLVKRVAASDKRTSFVGSDFLYEDVSGRNLAEDTHQLVKTTDEHYVVRNTPKRPETVEFNYFDVWIDRKNFVPMKMEFYNKNDKLYRVIESQKVEMIQKFPTVVKSVVKNLDTESITEMEFSEVKYDINLEDIFTERYLRRPPREATR